MGGLGDGQVELSAVEAALRLGVSRERVIRLVQSRKLSGRRDPVEGWRVSLPDVEAAATTAAA